MRVPVPTLPTRLPEISVADRQRRGVPVVRLVRAADDKADAGDSTGSTENPGAAGAASGEPGEAGASGLWTPRQVPAEWTPGGALTGKAGEVHALGNPARWLLGIGSDPHKPSAWRTAGGALARAVDADLAKRAGSVSRTQRSLQVSLPADLPEECVRAFVFGVTLGGYRFAVTGERAKPSLHGVVLLGAQELAEQVTEAARLAAATALARDLANSPSNVKDPAWLAGTAERVARDVPGLRVTVRDENWLAEHKFGGILAVGGGSTRPPRLIELAYRPRNASAHLLLVGKGITFDTGGLSIKPVDGMHLMRTDMSGGAAVIAAVRAIAQAKVPVRVTGLVPAAENHVSGSSYRPGDVVRHYGGTTTEVGNTDAEGRMVLADALAYGVEKFRPDVVVDVATLTGAIKVALGLRHGAVFANDDELAERVRSAGERVGEAWWRMPLIEDHADAVRSEIADVRQAPEGPGGVTAALFLREFVGGLPWAHLDIAGAARADKPYDDVTPGGTGFAARTLVEFAAGYA
ncbi:leucyl aminopeptidase family protein [Thermocrispum sp.]|uniref:leucyl aminopeptidase family protein n=1 Tax=Thermocrispum sp. TaxID=2060768 RepID=UPI00257BE72F|nr:leucyl aminopeptidase family protein [Thermocrispum sp.]